MADPIVEILEKLNKANEYYAKKSIASEKEYDEVADNIRRMGEEEFDSNSVKIERSQLAFKTKARVFTYSDVSRLIKDTTEQILLFKGIDPQEFTDDFSMTQEYVKENLYKDIVVGGETLEQDPELLLPRLYDTGANSIENQVINAKSNELRRDPTMPLLEHKIAVVIETGLITGTFPKDIGVAILGYGKHLNREREKEARTLPDYEEDVIANNYSSAEASAFAQLSVSDSITSSDLDNWLDNAKIFVTDFSMKLFDGTETDRVIQENELNEHVGANPIAVFADPTVVKKYNIRAKSLFQSNSMNNFVTNLINENNGIGNINDEAPKNQKPAYGSTNRRIIADAKREFDSYFSNIDDQTYSESIQREALVKGVSVSDLVLNKIEEGVLKNFEIVGPLSPEFDSQQAVQEDVGETLYQIEVNKRMEQTRKDNYAGNFKLITTGLQEALSKNAGYYFGGKAVTKDMVDPYVWDKWLDIFSSETEESAMSKIQPEINNSIIPIEKENVALKFVGRSENIRSWYDSAELNSEDRKFFIKELGKNIGDIDSPEAFEEFANGLSERFDRTQVPEIPSIEGMPGLKVRPPAPLPTDFDMRMFDNSLMDVALERPEFARFLQQQVSLPGFNEEFRKASVPKLDEEEFLGRIGGGLAEDNTEAALKRREEALLSMQQEQLGKFKSEAVGRGILQQKGVKGHGIFKSVEENLQKVQNKLAIPALKIELEKLLATQPDAGDEIQRVRKELVAKSKNQAVDAAFMPGGFAREMAREESTRPAMTQKEFFKQKLPGFEQRYESSPFFKAEEERKEREDRAKRSPLLRTRGPGRTIITTGRG